MKAGYSHETSERARLSGGGADPDELLSANTGKSKRVSVSRMVLHGGPPRPPRVEPRRHLQPAGIINKPQTLQKLLARAHMHTDPRLLHSPQSRPSLLQREDGGGRKHSVKAGTAPLLCILLPDRSLLTEAPLSSSLPPPHSPPQGVRSGVCTHRLLHPPPPSLALLKRQHTAPQLHSRRRLPL